jgi:hypothetical protein
MPALALLCHDVSCPELMLGHLLVDGVLFVEITSQLSQCPGCPVDRGRKAKERGVNGACETGEARHICEGQRERRNTSGSGSTEPELRVIWAWVDCKRAR